MIDITNHIYTKVREAILTQYPTANGSTEYQATFASLPAFTVVQQDNATHMATLDNTLSEHHADITFQCDFYADAISDARKMAYIADTVLQGQKFTRDMLTQTPNSDSAIARVTSRYEAIVAEGVTVDGTTTYQIYRR